MSSLPSAIVIPTLRSTSLFFFSSRRRHTRWPRDWSSDVCSSDLRLYAIAAGNDLPVVVANDSHYVADDEQVVHEAHMALGQKRTVSSESRYRFAGSGQFFRTGAQMRAVRPRPEGGRVGDGRRAPDRPGE